VTERDKSAQVIRRRAGRVLVVDADGKLLMLHGFDPARPDRPYWFTVGGGARAGESLAEAAARELREESGIDVQPAALGEPVWHDVTEFGFDGRQFSQEQDFFLLRVGSPDVSSDGLEDEEAAVVTGHRWWTADELESTDESFYPAELPRLLRELTAGRPSRRRPTAGDHVHTDPGSG
jgi:8-oxo-dGTP pyrophosphatase MutT (NUDIX family)